MCIFFGQNLRKLKLNSTEISSDWFDQVFPNLIDINLDISGVLSNLLKHNNFETIRIENIDQNISYPKTANFTDLKQLTINFEQIKILNFNLPNLQTLNIFGPSPELYIKEIPEIISVERLSLINFVYKPGKLKKMNKFPNLHSLKMVLYTDECSETSLDEAYWDDEDYVRFEDEWLLSIIHNLPKLKTFDLQNVKGFTHEGLLTFIKNAKYLRKLKIVDSSFYVDEKLITAMVEILEERYIHFELHVGKKNLHLDESARNLYRRNVEIIICPNEEDELVYIG